VIKTLTLTTLIVTFNLGVNSNNGFAQTTPSITGSSQSQGKSMTQTANISGSGGIVIQGRDHISRQQPNKVNVAASQSVTFLQVGNSKSNVNNRTVIVPLRGRVNIANVTQQAPKIGIVSDTKTGVAMTSARGQISKSNGTLTVSAVGLGIAIGMGKTSATSGSSATIINGIPSVSAFGTAIVGR
jgi:hypothetical protein